MGGLGQEVEYTLELLEDREYYQMLKRSLNRACKACENETMDDHSMCIMEHLMINLAENLKSEGIPYEDEDLYYPAIALLGGAAFATKYGIKVLEEMINAHYGGRFRLGVMRYINLVQHVYYSCSTVAWGGLGLALQVTGIVRNPAYFM